MLRKFLGLSVVLSTLVGLARCQTQYTLTITTDNNGKVQSITPGSSLILQAADNKTAPNKPMPIVVQTKGSRGSAFEVLSNEGTNSYCYSAINAANVNLWGKGGQAIVYLLALLYLFLGVSIVADVFMSAIEVITSQEREIVTPDPEDPSNRIVINVQVWNETVANLTLMALGSSAPEIILAVLETVQTLGQDAGPLGASTIVGSAAFNLFVISGVCVVSVPERDDRKGEAGFRTLSQMGVFLITAFSSVWAYLWMYICIVLWTPNVVTVEEAIITFLKFPLLVGAAYAQDAGYFDKLWAACSGSDTQVADSATSADETQAIEPVEGTPSERSHSPLVIKPQDGVRQKIRIKDATVVNDEKHTAFALIKATDPTHLSLEANEAYVENLANQIAATRPEKKLSRMQYRVNATRMIAGKKPLFTVEEEVEAARERRKSKIQEEEAEYEEKHAVEMKEKEKDVGGPREKMYKTTFEFASRRYAVREDEGTVKVIVRRTGDISGIHTVFFRTADGTAEENDDYVPAQGTLVFNAGEAQQTIEIEIKEDEAVEDDEDFYVILENPTGESVNLGTNNITSVIIIDVSQPGTLQFKHRSERCRETDGKVILTVERVNGSMDEVGCEFETRDGTAIEGQHYRLAQGKITFAHGETEQIIELEVIDNEELEAERQFSVVLSHPFGKASLNSDRDIATITISDDERYSKLVNRVIDAVAQRKRQLALNTASWKEQFQDAMEVGDDAGWLGFLLHSLAFPWKVIFSLVPPTTYANGWLTFVISLICVGAVTYVIAEYASMLGCILGIKEEIVAITLVAMGTSMPDTFASRTATILAPDADAAIGNVTGSNSVNVFLGLGLPWVIAALYGAATGKPYGVPQGALSFAVSVFTPLAAATLIGLLLRRYFAGGELGGNYTWPTFAVFVGFWGLFLLLSILNATDAL